MEGDEKIEDFYPHTVKFMSTVCSHLPALLDEICGEHPCISLLFDEHFYHWDSS